MFLTLSGLTAALLLVTRRDLPAAPVAATVPLVDGYNTLFGPGVGPRSRTPDTDPHSVEIGVRFQPLVTGTAYGLRFFRADHEQAAHPASLWDDNGRRLARLTFPASGRGGWQEAKFTRPVPLTGGETYVASYHAPHGYAVSEYYFGDAPVTRGLLTMLADRADSPNGVYTYGAHPRFPTSHFRSSNYWIDVLFTSGGGVPVPAPTPVVTATPPASPTPAPTVGSLSPPATTPGHPSPSPSAPSQSTTQPAPAPGPPGALAPNTVPKPGQVGFLGDPAALKVIDNSAAAPPGTTWQSGAGTGWLRVDGDNVTLDGVYVKGSVDYYGKGTLTIRNSIVEGNGGIWSAIEGRSGHLAVSDSTVRWRPGTPPPGANWGNGAINGDSTMTIVRCDISGQPDGIDNGPGNSTFEQNYIHGPALLGSYPNNTHNDGIQMYGGGGLVIRYNRIELGGYDGTHQNSSLFIQPDSSSPAVAPQIIGNYLEGGGYMLRLEAPTTGAVVLNNTFGPLNGGWGDAYQRAGVTIAQWSGNVTFDGKSVPLPPTV